MSRLSCLLGLLQQLNVDGVLLTGRPNRRYIAAYDISEGMAIVCRSGCRYFTDSRYLEDAQKHLPDFEVQLVNRENTYIKLIQNAIVDFGLATLGYEEEEITAGEFSRLNNALAAKLVPAQQSISEPRMIKSPDEIESIRTAQNITDLVFTDMLGVIRAGLTEKQIYAELIYRIYQQGGEAPSFDPVVVSGPNTSLPHGVAGDRVLQEGDFVTLDFGCKVNGYCSDMTRTVAIGYATEEMQKVYHTVLQAQLAGLNATKSGKSGAEIDAAARAVIEDAGYGKYFGHGYGHGVGLEIHERPNCSPSWQKPIPAGCVCSAEPGIYIPDKFGVRIEDLVVITQDGYENLTKSTKSLIIL